MNKATRSLTQAMAAAAISALAGFSVWAFSPRLVGTPLPWDAQWPFYSMVLLGTGLLVSLFTRTPWPGFSGMWTGQIIALFVLPLDRSTNMLGPTVWYLLGVVSTGVGALIFVAGWYARKF